MLHTTQLLILLSLYTCASGTNASTHNLLLPLVWKWSEDTLPTEETSSAPDIVLKRAFYDNKSPYHRYEKNGKVIHDHVLNVLLETFQQHTGIKVELVEPTPPIFGTNVNGTYNGELGLVQSGLADVPYHVSYLTPDRFKFADYSVPLYATPFCIAVVKAPLVPFTEILMLPFGRRTWFAILSSLLVSTLVWYFIYSPRGAYVFRSQGIARAVGDILEITFTGGCSRRSSTMNQKIIQGSLLLFILVFSNTYQGKLFGLLSSPPRTADLNTLEDVDRVVSHIYTYSVMNDIFDDTESTPSIRNLRNKLVLTTIPEFPKLLKENMTGFENGVLLYTEYYLLLAHSKHLMEDGRVKFHVVEECLNPPGLSSLIVRKNSPLKDRIMSFAALTMENGLFIFWNRQFYNRLDATGLTELQLPRGLKRKPQPLHLTQLEGPFLLLGLGVTGGFVVFLLELASRWCVRPHRPSTPLSFRQQPLLRFEIRGNNFM